MTHYFELPKGATIFTHVDPETNKTTVIWVSGLMASLAYKNIEMTHIEIDQEFAATWLPRRGIEAHRVDALRKVPTTRLAPVLMLQWPDGSHLLADGSHRYFVAAARGVANIRAKLVPLEVWQPFIVEGFPDVDPDTLLKSYSGIKKKR